jgi:hypothetical protein
VRFRVGGDLTTVADCNGSICTKKGCTKKGFLHLIVPAAQFQLLEGADALSTYTFNTGTAKHTFCRFCGIRVGTANICSVFHCRPTAALAPSAG